MLAGIPHDDIKPQDTNYRAHITHPRSFKSIKSPRVVQSIKYTLNITFGLLEEKFLVCLKYEYVKEYLEVERGTIFI